MVIVRTTAKTYPDLSSVLVPKDFTFLLMEGNVLVSRIGDLYSV